MWSPLSPALCVGVSRVWEGEESSGALDRPAGPGEGRRGGGEEEGQEKKRARREANFFSCCSGVRFPCRWFILDGFEGYKNSKQSIKVSAAIPP